MNFSLTVARGAPYLLPGAEMAIGNVATCRLLALSTLLPSQQHLTSYAVLLRCNRNKSLLSQALSQGHPQTHHQLHLLQTLLDFSAILAQKSTQGTVLQELAIRELGGYIHGSISATQQPSSLPGCAAHLLEEQGWKNELLTPSIFCISPPPRAALLDLLVCIIF